MSEYTGRDFIGCKTNPAGFDSLRLLARTAKAYDALVPYPNFSAMTNKKWLTEEQGPYPRCLPFVRNIVTKGARWLFGKPVTFRVEDNKPLSKLINDAWTENSMGARSVPMARMGALSGGVALKWSYDPERSEYPQIHVLDPAEHTRFYWHPHDTTQLLMVRVQYPIFDPAKGVTVWYREEWTDEELVVYEDIPQAVLVSTNVNDPYQIATKVDDYQDWKIKTREPNEFGVIPLWYVQNIHTGREFGDGDLWSYFQTIDLINYTRNLEHLNNQKGQDPGKAYIDLEPETDDAPGRDMVGESLRTTTDAVAQGKIQELSPDATMRPHMRQYIEDLKRELYQAVGSVELSVEDVTNKGNLTRAVLEQVYGPLIEATDEKRKSYGEDGLCTFFERMCDGMANAGVSGWSADTDVQIHWPDMFHGTPEEHSTEVQRQKTMVEARFTTPERAVRAVAALDGIIDTDKLEADLAKLPPTAPDGNPGGSNNDQNRTDRTRLAAGSR